MRRPLANLFATAATLGLSLASPAGASAPSTEADRALARSVVEELVSYRTARGHGQVPKMAATIAARLKSAGFADADIQMVPVSADGEETVGLVVRFRGTGRSGRKPVALLGHMDVVDAAPEAWSSDPFKPVEKDGYLYGRGAVDNKAGVALLITTFMRLKASGWTPERDLLLALSGDEETGMRTTRALTQHPWVRQAEFALNSDAGVGEVDKDGANPSFSIQSAEKTFATFEITASNPGGHSSAPRPDNAIYDAARVIQAIQSLKFPVTFNEISRVMVTELAARKPGAYGDALRTLMTDPNNAAARAVAEREVESNLLWTTCVPTMLRGGTAPNALPPSTTVTVNCRIFPGTTVAAVQQQIERAVAGPAIRVTLAQEGIASPVSPIRPDLFESIRRAVRVGYPDAPVQPSMSSGGTDGREFRAAGIPTYGAGSLALVRIEDARAHGADERLPLAAFYKELAFWDTLLRDIAGAPSRR
jgi:acetylornithine deacetylase/succinyl-diaminopimelate desuccinylase-like protein